MNAMRICSFLWLLLWLVWLGAWLRTKKTQELAGFGSRLRYGAPVVLAFYLLFSENLPFRWLELRFIPHNIVLEILAVTLTAVGIAFAIWARFYIGQNWSSAVTIKVGHQLIRTGPYAWVRAIQFIRASCWPRLAPHWPAVRCAACSHSYCFGWDSG